MMTRANKRTRQAQRSEDLPSLIVEHSSDAIVVVNPDGIVKFVNPAAERLFNRPANELVGENFGFPIDSGKPQELSIVRPGKELRVAEMRVAKIESNSTILQVANLRDITELVRMREDLRSMSFLDELTELYNRRGFLTLAQQHLEIADRAQREMLVFFADLDNMKWINDTLGHHEGDRALIETASILKETFREPDIIARMGGDEFAVLAIEAHRQSVHGIIARLHKNLQARNGKANSCYQLSMSLGIVRYNPEKPCSIHQSLEQADALMYQEKRAKQKSHSRSDAKNDFKNIPSQNYQQAPKIRIVS